MSVVCGWCRRFLRMKEPLQDTCVSHGLCEGCAVTVMAEVKKVTGTEVLA